jgi:hypothetical protein
VLLIFPHVVPLADVYARIYIHVVCSSLPREERLGVEISSCWRAVFSNLAKKNLNWEWILKTFGDSIESRYKYKQYS